MATCFRSYEETHYDSYQQAGMTGHSRMATLKQPFQKGKPEFEPGKAKGEKEEGQEKSAGEMAQQVKAMDPDKSCVLRGGERRTDSSRWSSGPSTL